MNLQLQKQNKGKGEAVLSSKSSKEVKSLEQAEEIKDAFADLRQMAMFDIQAPGIFMATSDLSPGRFVGQLIAKLKVKDVNAQLDDLEWKVTFTIKEEIEQQEKPELLEESESCTVLVEVMQMPVHDSQIAIKCTRSDGSLPLFLKWYKETMKHFGMGV